MPIWCSVESEGTLSTSLSAGTPRLEDDAFPSLPELPLRSRRAKGLIGAISGEVSRETWRFRGGGIGGLVPGPDIASANAVADLVLAMDGMGDRGRSGLRDIPEVSRE